MPALPVSPSCSEHQMALGARPVSETRWRCRVATPCQTFLCANVYAAYSCKQLDSGGKAGHYTPGKAQPVLVLVDLGPYGPTITIPHRCTG